MLREHQKDRIIEVQRCINAVLLVVVELPLFAGEPAAHTIVQEVSVKLLGKGLISLRVANHTGRVFSWKRERPHQFQEGSRHASIAQEDFWNLPVRAIDGINTNTGGPEMAHRLQPLDTSQIDIGKDGPCNRRLGKVWRGLHGGTGKDGSVQNGFFERGFIKNSSTQISST